MQSRIITAVGPSALAVYLTFAVACKPASAEGQENPSTSYESKSLPGKIVTQVPYFPSIAKRRGLTGRSCLAYSVDATGHAQNIVVIESAGSDLDDHAKKLLSYYHFDVPTDWVASGGPGKRYRIGFIFELSNKPKVPPFDDAIPSVVIRSTGIPGA